MVGQKVIAGRCNAWSSCGMYWQTVFCGYSLLCVGLCRGECRARGDTCLFKLVCCPLLFAGGLLRGPFELDSITVLLIGSQA